jgi:uncharacterized protein (DUF1499 family)
MPIPSSLYERVGMLARLLRLPVAPPPPPVPLGVVSGRLSPCPPRANCVSSYSRGRVHGMAPLPGSGGRDASMGLLRQVLAAERGTRIVDDRPDYIRAEVTTALWRFVDDVEFLWDEQAGVIHFRSASRVGRSDLGANRRRMERIAAKLAAGAPSPAAA